jgi:hypothetical protein
MPVGNSDDTANNNLTQLVSLQTELSQLRESVQKFERNNPHVENVSKLDRRVKREVAFVSQLIDLENSRLNIDGYSNVENVAALGSEQPSAEGALPNDGETLLTNIQGLRNNLRGVAAELATALEAPNVVALNKTFPLTSPGEESPR